MIQNDEEYQSTIQAITLTEKALLSLKRKVGQVNPEKYQILSQSYINYLTDLRFQRDSYLGMTSAEEDAIPLWMRLEGPHIHSGIISIDIIANFLKQIKNGVQRIAEYIDQDVIRDTGRPREDIRRLSNFNVKILPGSIRVGFSYPTPIQQTLYGVHDNPVKKAVEKLIICGEWCVGNRSEALESLFPNEIERYLVLTQLQNMIPKEGGEITSLELSGHAVGENLVIIKPEAKQKVKAALEKVIQPERVVEEGTMRNIDLDDESFYLRNRPDNLRDILCNYTYALQDDAISALNKKIQVIGSQHKDKFGKILHITVDEINVLEIE